jgi:hypothetical protein
VSKVFDWLTSWQGETVFGVVMLTAAAISAWKGNTGLSALFLVLAVSAFYKAWAKRRTAARGVRP